MPAKKIRDRGEAPAAACPLDPWSGCRPSGVQAVQAHIGALQAHIGRLFPRAGYGNWGRPRRPRAGPLPAGPRQRARARPRALRLTCRLAVTLLVWAGRLR
jgi:hypothetical protein